MKTTYAPTYVLAAVLMAGLATGATASAAAPHASLAEAASELLAIESEFHREIGRLPRPAYEDFAPHSETIYELAGEVQRLAERGRDPNDIAERLDGLQSEIYYLDALFVDIRDAHFGGYGSLWRLDRLIGELKNAAQIVVAENDALQGYGPPPRRPRSYGGTRSGYRSIDDEWQLERSVDRPRSRDRERDDDGDDRGISRRRVFRLQLER